MTFTDIGPPPSSPPPSTPPEAEQEPKPARRRAIVFATVALLLVLVAGAGYSLFTHDRKVDEKAAPTESSITTTTLPILTPTDAALALYVAWQRGDSEEADRAATAPGAVDMSDIKTTDAAGLEFKGCTEPENEMATCAWEREDAKLTMTVTAPDKGSPQVKTAKLVKD